MDTLTHTVLGACTGQVIAGKQAGKKAMLMGALINNLPDLDMIANLWHTPAESLLSHRGITHSFFFMVLSIPILISLFRFLFPSVQLSWQRWFVMISHGLLLHIGLDACTTYGTGWFEPFNHYRVSFNTLFIIDPLFLLPLLLSSIILLMVGANHPVRTKIAATGLGLSLFYLAVTIGIKLSVDKTIRSELAVQNIQHEDYAGTPTPMNNLLWYVLVKQKDAYKAGYYSILDKEARILFDSVPKNAALLNGYRTNSDVIHLLQFSKGYYQLQKLQGDSLRFSDLRFGPMSIDQIAEEPAVFRFDIVPGGMDTSVRQTPFATLKDGDIKRLYERVKGQ